MCVCVAEIVGWQKGVIFWNTSQDLFVLACVCVCVFV